MGKLRPEPARPLRSRNWFGKAAAGLIAGYGLAIAVSSLFALYGPQGLNGGAGKINFSMWLVAPIWVLLLSFVFLFRDGRRAWLWLGGANLAAFALLFGLRALLP